MTHAVHILTGLAAVDFLDSRWRELYRKDTAATPYQSPSWLMAWAELLPVTATPVVLAAQAPTGRTLAAMALARADGETGARYSALSSPHAQYVRPVGPHADDPVIAHALAAHLALLAQDGRHIAMTDVPVNSGLGRGLEQAAASRGWHHSTTRCGRIRLPNGPTALPRSMRRDEQRRRRDRDRLAADHEIAYRRTRHTAELLDAYDVLACLSADRVSSPAHAGAADVERWRTVLARCGAATATIAGVAVDGTVVAAQLCLFRGREAHAVALAEDPAHRHLEPGRTLLSHLVADLAAEGFHTLHLGRHADAVPYRPRWSTTLSAISTPLPAPA
ncbi:GNAT family N-acetyltransferase [Streptomyces sp. NPDC002004]